MYKKFLKKSKKGLPNNILLVSMKSNLLERIIFDVHMHSITHTVEPQIDMPIVDLSHGNTLATDPDTWQDVVALLCYMMLVFLFVANEAFHRFSMWEQVSI